jgi:hypothetical protein
MDPSIHAKIKHTRLTRLIEQKSAKKISENYALKSMDAVGAKLEHAILYLELGCSTDN